MARRGRVAAVVFALVSVVVAALGLTAVVRQLGPDKSLVVPSGWARSWKHAHLQEGRDVVLAWGDLAGARPEAPPAELRFDPERAVAQLDALYSLDVQDLGVVA